MEPVLERVEEDSLDPTLASTETFARAGAGTPLWRDWAWRERIGVGRPCVKEQGIAVVLRYMGTKRHMAEPVREAVIGLDPKGRVVDLFSGMGSVTESLASFRSVTANDAFNFACSIARARFTGSERPTKPAVAAARIRDNYLERLAQLVQTHGTQLSVESDALAGGLDALKKYVDTALHAANSPSARRSARSAAETGGLAHYELATLYFSAGYLSLQQAIEADAIRAAIDADGAPDERDWLLGAWIVALSAVLNAPGHTAQFLRPNSQASYRRVSATWRRSLWQEFEASLERLSQVGTDDWRAANRVRQGDALDYLVGGNDADLGLIYADPPYTKDHYSRYYHLYETLYKYDYPDAIGQGRVRSDRFHTLFSVKTGVAASFHALCRGASRLGVPLVISYPASGLLESAGGSVYEIASSYYRSVEIRSLDAAHSTMGASKGVSKKNTVENLYLCTT